MSPSTAFVEAGFFFTPPPRVRELRYAFLCLEKGWFFHAFDGAMVKEPARATWWPAHQDEAAVRYLNYLIRSGPAVTWELVRLELTECEVPDHPSHPDLVWRVRRCR